MQTGKLFPSVVKQELIEREVDFHLGALKREFDCGKMEDSIFNADETHFVVDLHDRRTLAIKGDTDVKYSDVVSGDIGMTMIFMLGGCSKARLELPRIILQRKTSSYHIMVFQIQFQVCFIEVGQKDGRKRGILENGLQKDVLWDRCLGENRGFCMRVIHPLTKVSEGVGGTSSKQHEAGVPSKKCHRSVPICRIFHHSEDKSSVAADVE